MTKNLKFFFIAFLASLPFWWGINVLGENLKDFIFWQEASQNLSQNIFTARVSQFNVDKYFEPIRNNEVEDLKIEAKSAISTFVNPKDQEKILFEKASTEKRPIASLTKLMSAFVVLNYYDLDETTQISKRAADQPGIGAGKLKIGESFKIKDLLYPMLMESNNGATLALAQVIGENGFVELMNLEAKNLDLKNTYFVNPTGLDPEKIGDPLNYSTVQDLVKLIKYLLYQQPLIFKILSTSEFDFYSSDGVFHHKVSNTDKLLGKISGVIGGKTGWTYEAGGCLLLVLKAPENRGYVVNVILGSEDRFKEMERVLNWIYQAYKW